MNNIETIIPIEIIELEDKHNLHPIIEAKINVNPIRLVIDTGASHTCIDKKEVKSLLKNKNNISSDIVMGIGNKKMRNTIVTIQELQLGEVIIKDYPVVALKISHINKMLKILGLKPINGLLGSDLLYKYNAVIDYKNSCLTLNTNTL
ncbi:MAG TPA: retropepsin-like aspartic protease [Bacteroidales bacterium]|nr:retropepsin-like aspartic protease [Bacteroidales bacterium]